jgi:hypothetical protein
MCYPSAGVNPLGKDESDGLVSTLPLILRLIADPATALPKYQQADVEKVGLDVASQGIGNV